MRPLQTPSVTENQLRPPKKSRRPLQRQIETGTSAAKAARIRRVLCRG